MKRLIPIVAVGALLAVAPAAQAAVHLSGGQTRLTVNKGTANALASLGVKVAPTGKASARGRHVKFPISGGSIDPATAAGTIRHTGGLRFSAGGTRVTLKNYVVKVGGRITLSAKVGKGRVKILRLVGTPKVSRLGLRHERARPHRGAQPDRGDDAEHGVRREGVQGGPAARQGRGQGAAVADRAARAGLDGARARRVHARRAGEPRRDAGDHRPGDPLGHDRELPDHGRQGEPRPERRDGDPLGRAVADGRARPWST